MSATLKCDLKLSIDCYTTQSLHSANILLNGENILAQAEVQDEIFGRQPICLTIPRDKVKLDNVVELVNVPPGDGKALLVESFAIEFVRSDSSKKGNRN